MTLLLTFSPPSHLADPANLIPLMALVSYTIRSHYDPRNHISELEQLDASARHPSLTQDEPEEAPLQATDIQTDSEEQKRLQKRQLELQTEEEWHKAAGVSWHRRKVRGPIFVAASSSDSSTTAVDWPVGCKGKGKEREDVSGWYASLTSRPGSSADMSRAASPVARNTVELSPPDNAPDSVQVSTKPTPEGVPTPSHTTSLDPSLSLPKPNWFSSASSSTHLSSSTTNNCSSSLADMLDRNPPPLPTEPRFLPPVFLELNPTNRGWKMLERWGWKEGEGVGGVSSVQHRPGDGTSVPTGAGSASGSGAKSNRNSLSQRMARADREVIDLTGIDEPETIDLTMSDSEAEQGDGDQSDGASSVTLDDDDTLDRGTIDLESDNVFGIRSGPSLTQTMMRDDSGSRTYGHTQSHNHRTTLLTPIPTIVKTDRLGIGLRARTQRASGSTQHESRSILSHVPSSSRHSASSSRRFGAGASSSTSTSSYRVPVKLTNITPSFTRHLESVQAAKRRRERVGRGRRGFEREYKKTEGERRQLIAYMNE